MTVDEIIKLLDLRPHPEGGFYREIYKSTDCLAGGELPERYASEMGPPRNFIRESMEWQVPPDMEKKALEAVTGKDTKSLVASKPTTESCSPRSICTSIYYLLTPDTFSAIHRLKGDEIYHFYLGDPIEMVNLYGNGKWKKIRLGHDILSGDLVQHTVPHGVWQGSRLADGGKFALMGTTMSPGFAFEDCEFGTAKSLVEQYPTLSDEIQRLTRP